MWHEYLQRETGAFLKSTASLLTVIPHVSHWISTELHAEIAELLKSPPCLLEVRKYLVMLQERIVGQSPREVSIATQASDHE